MKKQMALPLSHIRVLDLTRVRAGPTCVRQLADWGADVVKIEQPGRGDGQMGDARLGPDFQNLHRNKRSMTLNLKTGGGKAVFMRLAESADVVVENYRPQVKHRLGIDYEAVKAVNLGMAASANHPDLGDIDLVGQPIKLSGSTFAVRRPTPGLGQHTDELLAEAGYSAADVEALRAAGAV